MYILTYRDDPRVTEDNFILSDINADFLRLHNIQQTVEQFKEQVRNCQHYFVVETGNSAKMIQHTRVFDIKDFKNGQKYRKMCKIKVRIEELPENLQKFENFLIFCENSQFLQILQNSREYPNRNSRYVRKYLEIGLFEDFEEVANEKI